MFVLKNRNVPQLSEANFHANIQKYSPYDLIFFDLTVIYFMRNVKIIIVTTPKTPQNDRLYTHIHQPRRKTS